jgi:hypothetical protein
MAEISLTLALSQMERIRTLAPFSLRRRAGDEGKS